MIAGIDPGLDGALAFLDPQSCRIVAMIGMPALKLAKGKGMRRQISPQSLAVLIEDHILGLTINKVYIERVSSSPQMGVTSAFQFGRGFGVVEGIIAALGWPVEYVTPAKWKRAMAVPAAKDDARMRACQLLPKDAELWTPRRGFATEAQCSGRAEAALIALYGAREERFAGVAG